MKQQSGWFRGFLVIRRFFFLLNFLLVLYTLLVYQLAYEADIKHWVAGFLMMSLPFVWIANVFFMLIWAIGGSWKLLLSAVVIALGFPFWQRTFQFNPPAEAMPPHAISVLSYNTMYMDYFDYYNQGDTASVKYFVASAPLLDADIECYQELYNDDQFVDFQILRKLKRSNQFYTYMHATEGNDQGQGAIGLAIFSKYKMFNKREVYWKLNNNGILAVDMAVGQDTITVINMQMHSMGIRLGRVLAVRNDKDRVKDEARTVLGQLKAGFQERIHQTAELEKIIRESRYPIILCGDLNELPYGYAYGRIRKYLANGFEERGRGFGFTYNHLPRYIRIDHVFFQQDHFTILGFNTLNTLPFSDHYPVKAYLMPKSKSDAWPTD